MNGQAREMGNYLKQALAMADRSVYIVFFQGGTKVCTHKGWQNMATTSQEEVIAMAKAHPTWTNYACVGRAVEGGRFIFDEDSGGAIRAEYEAIYGALSPTLKVKTFSGKFHYYFKHSAKSLAYQKKINKAYISEKKIDGKGELWSLRMHNSYGVGPGSIVTENGRTGEYAIAWDAEVIEIPDTLLDFLIARYEAAQERENTQKSAAETANPHASASETEGASKAWKKPPNKKEWEKELKSDEPIGEGERNNVLISIAGHLHHALKLGEPAIDAILQSINARRCLPALAAQEVSTIARSAAQYGNTKEGVKAEGRTIEEVHQLVRLAIYSTPADKRESGWEIPLDDKEAANFVTALIYEHLKTRGKFYFADNRGYLLLEGQEETPIEVSSENYLFTNMLCEYGIFPAQEQFKKIGAFIRMKAKVEGMKATVSFSSHYNARSKSFYFAESAGNLIRVTKGKIDRVRNGTDGELFVFPETDKADAPFRINLDNLPTVKYSLIPNEDSLLFQMLFKDLVFESSTLTMEGKRILLTIYILLLLLGGIIGERPMLQMIGPSGCGKSTFLKLIGRLIIGSTFSVQTLPETKSDFETTLVNNSLAFFDNVDNVPPAVRSLFCTAVTGFNIKKRELFTDTGEINIPSKATLGLTSLVAQLLTTEQTNRSMVFNMRRRTGGYLAEEILLARFDAQREALVSEIIVRGQMVLQALHAQSKYEPRVNTRLAGIGTLISRVARHEAWEPMAKALLKAWGSEQLEGALKDDDLSNYLQKWITCAEWKPVELHAGELSKVLRPSDMFDSDWKSNTSWKGNAKSLSNMLYKSEESYSIRFGLTIRSDASTGNSLFCFHPTPEQIALLKPDEESAPNPLDVNLDSNSATGVNETTAKNNEATKKRIDPTWDNDPTPPPIEWNRPKPVFIRPGDCPLTPVVLSKKDEADVPDFMAERKARVNEGEAAKIREAIQEWARVLMHGGASHPSLTPTRAITMFCARLAKKDWWREMSGQDWNNSFAGLQAIWDKGALRLVEECQNNRNTVDKTAEGWATYRSAVETVKGLETIRAHGGSGAIYQAVWDEFTTHF